MEFVDTHCHIQSIGLRSGEENTRELWAKAPDLTIEGTIASAHNAGVTKLIAVGCTLEDSELAISCAQQNESVYASIGIHPHEAKEYAGNKALQDAFAALATSPKVVAVGECGLDYFYTHSPKEDQIAILRFQIELALKHDLPMIFHVREAFDDFWPIFEQYKGIRGVLHSYTDNQANLTKAVSYGLKIGVNGIATFAKQDAQVAMYKAIPIDNLLLETDAPFLTPVPHRGTICESKYVRVTGEYLARLRGESLEDLATITTHNARNLFGLE